MVFGALVWSGLRGLSSATLERMLGGLLHFSVFLFLVYPSADGQPVPRQQNAVTAFNTLLVVAIAMVAWFPWGMTAVLFRLSTSVLTLQESVACMPFADALWECRHQQPLDYNQKVSSKG